MRLNSFENISAGCLSYGAIVVQPLFSHGKLLKQASNEAESSEVEDRKSCLVRQQTPYLAGCPKSGQVSDTYLKREWA